MCLLGDHMVTTVSAANHLGFLLNGTQMRTCLAVVFPRVDLRTVNKMMSSAETRCPS